MSDGTGHCDTYTGLLSRVPRYEPHCTDALVSSPGHETD